MGSVVPETDPSISFSPRARHSPHIPSLAKSLPWLIPCFLPSFRILFACWLTTLLWYCTSTVLLRSRKIVIEREKGGKGAKGHATQSLVNGLWVVDENNLEGAFENVREITWKVPMNEG